MRGPFPDNVRDGMEGVTSEYGSSTLVKVVTSKNPRACQSAFSLTTDQDAAKARFGRKKEHVTEDEMYEMMFLGHTVTSPRAYGKDVFHLRSKN